MPERVWAHDCCDSTGASQACPACGRPGEFLGWGLTVPEAMARFRLSYGLDPLRPDIRTAKARLDGMRRACERCHGAGLVGDVHEWRACPQCEGTGGTWSASEDAIREVYLDIVREWPGAAAPGALTIHPVLPPMDVLGDPGGNDPGDDDPAGADAAGDERAGEDAEMLVAVTLQGPWGVVTHNGGPPDPPEVPAAELRRPGALIREGMIALTRVSPRDLDRAERCFRDALELLVQRLGEPHPKVSYVLDRLGVVYQLRRQLDDAERLYLRSLAVLDDGRQPSHWNDLTLLNLAIVYGWQGRTEERDAVLRRYVP
jgi:tetratricopeptide (TPR) repeat protein